MMSGSILTESLSDYVACRFSSGALSETAPVDRRYPIDPGLPGSLLAAAKPLQLLYLHLEILLVATIWPCDLLQELLPILEYLENLLVHVCTFLLWNRGHLSLQAIHGAHMGSMY